eukprot:5184567-Ditylum_brightwellii.AAC.1
MEKSKNATDPMSPIKCMTGITVQTNTTNSVNGEIHANRNDGGNGDNNTVLSGLSIEEGEKEQATGIESNGDQEFIADDNTVLSGFTALKTPASPDHTNDNKAVSSSTALNNQQVKMSDDQMNNEENFWTGRVN